jgi:hypothetical protein
LRRRACKEGEVKVTQLVALEHGDGQDAGRLGPLLVLVLAAAAVVVGRHAPGVKGLRVKLREREREGEAGKEKVVLGNERSRPTAVSTSAQLLQSSTPIGTS